MVRKEDGLFRGRERMRLLIGQKGHEVAAPSARTANLQGQPSCRYPVSSANKSQWIDLYPTPLGLASIWLVSLAERGTSSAFERNDWRNALHRRRCCWVDVNDCSVGTELGGNTPRAETMSNEEETTRGINDGSTFARRGDGEYGHRRR